MPAPALGLVLTHAPTPQALRGALALMRADLLKVVPAWGLDGGWLPATIAEAANMAGTLIVRTSWGDPSYADGTRALPDPRRILDELGPWLRIRPDAWVEIGNEPRQPAPGREIPAIEIYAKALADTVVACRAMYPHARLLAPAHSLNDPAQDAQVARWLAACAPSYRACDAVALHAYSAEQLRRGLSLVRSYVGALPCWLTELNVGEDLSDVERGKRLWALLLEAPVEAAALYHLDQSEASPSEAQGPSRYRLSATTLSQIGMRDDGLLGASGNEPAIIRYGQTRIAGFAMDVIQWRSVAAFRAHLARYIWRTTAPWAKGVTLHHTESPLPAQWRGPASMLSLATFYRDRRQWDRGPHLYVVSGAPNAAHDGIWQLTPLNERGIHAVAFNAERWGIELVGDFDATPPPLDVAVIGLATAAALLDWAGLPSSAVNGHRDDPSTTKTCPGSAMDLAAVRRGIAALRGA